MPDVTWTHFFLRELLGMIPLETNSLIDLGCGRGIIGALMRIYRSPKKLVGVDVFQPYIDFCKQFRFYDEVHKWDLREIPLPFKDKEFEVATCIETIEHLPKKKGQQLLDELERLANRVIITTPNKRPPGTQEAYDGNPFQQHLSMWETSDFQKKGYKIGGFRKLLRTQRRPIRILITALPKLEHRFPYEPIYILAAKKMRIQNECRNTKEKVAEKVKMTAK